MHSGAYGKRPRDCLPAAAQGPRQRDVRKGEWGQREEGGHLGRPGLLRELSQKYQRRGLGLTRQLGPLGPPEDLPQPLRSLSLGLPFGMQTHKLYS